LVGDFIRILFYRAGPAGVFLKGLSARIFGCFTDKAVAYPGGQVFPDHLFG
jgi:hypothetical protein